MIGGPFRHTEQYKSYGVLLARVDDRLVHGQVVVGWGQVVRARYIVLCNDAAAADDFARAIIETASAPADVVVKVLSVKDAADDILSGAYRKGGVILLFENPADVLRFMDVGVYLDRVNLGGMHQRPGKTEVATAVWLDESDCADLKALVAGGVRVTVQMVPAEAEVDIEVLISRCAV